MYVRSNKRRRITSIQIVEPEAYWPPDGVDGLGVPVLPDPVDGDGALPLPVFGATPVPVPVPPLEPGMVEFWTLPFCCVGAVGVGVVAGASV
jgi:hypothetical protein